MKFSEIVDHLGKRGFVTRKLWENKSAIFFGMDNICWFVCPSSFSKMTFWRPCLAEINADDWIIIPEFWNGSKDDFKVFDSDEVYIKVK